MVLFMAKENIYKEAREKTPSVDKNKRWLTQEDAANLLNTSKGTICKWENDLLKNMIPSPQKVIAMSELYKDPGLRKRHCTQHCPIGKRDYNLDEARKTIFQTGYGLIKANEDLIKFKEELFDILEDGVVDDDEVKKLIKLKSTISSVQKLLDEIEIAMLVYTGEKETYN